MRKSLRERFTDLVRPYSRGYRLAYVLTSVSVAVLEVVSHAISTPLDMPSFLLLTALCVSLAMAPWLNRAGDLLYVGAFAAAGATSCSVSLAFPALGMFLIATVWIIHHRTPQASLLLTGYILLMLLQDGSQPSRIFSDVLLSAVTFAIAFALRNFIDGAARSRRELEESKVETAKAAAAVRAKLAAGLHDTIARDLARISISLESLVAVHPELSEEIAPVVDLARISSRRLKPMIAEMNLEASAPSLRTAVKESTLMLRSRELDLTVHMSDDIDDLLSRQAILIGSLFVREAATNALKYARRGTSVNLFIEVAGGELSLMMVNEIGERSLNDALTGGFGLVNLQSHIEAEGGRLSFVSDSDRWIINAVIPNPGKETPDE